MYFLRRRHSRKPQSEARRSDPPVQGGPLEVTDAYHEPEPAEPPKPVVITKAKRQRVADPEDGDCKPAGTFRSGTLHIARSPRSEPSHGGA